MCFFWNREYAQHISSSVTYCTPNKSNEVYKVLRILAMIEANINLLIFNLSEFWGPIVEELSIDEVKRKHLLVAKLKLKMWEKRFLHFLFQLCRSLFKCQCTFHILWTNWQKKGLQIFERWYINRNMEQNVKEGPILGLPHA